MYLRRKRAARVRLFWQWSVAGAILLALGTLVLSLGFAGSPKTLPEGATIAGIDVGGLSTRQAITRLERRYEALKTTSAVFTAGPRKWRIRPNEMILEIDWAAAVESARRQGDGFAPVRGLRRLGARFFGADVSPRARVSTAVLAHELHVLGRRIDRPERDASIRLRGLQPEIVRGATGRRLDREAAARLIVGSLVSLERTPAALPVRISQPEVTAADLIPTLEEVRTAVSGPVRLALGPTRWRIPRWRIAKMLVLPRGGQTSLAVGGPGANEFFQRFRTSVDREPADAGFVVMPSDHVVVRPARTGHQLDVDAARRAILAAALTPTDRIARLVVGRALPERTTREARAMGITGRVAGYTTYYGGEPNRIHNVQLVARLIDGALIAPGATFSFNGTTGVGQGVGLTGPHGETGPAGPKGEKGDRGETGPPGPSACDGLLCPGTDLAAGQHVSLTIDGVQIATVGAYRTSCETPSTCTVRVGGAEITSLALEAWFVAAMNGDTAAATRDFSLTVFNSAGVPIRRFFVDSGIPIEMTHQNDRFQLVFSAEAVQRLAP